MTKYVDDKDKNYSRVRGELKRWVKGTKAVHAAPKPAPVSTADWEG